METPQEIYEFHASTLKYHGFGEDPAMLKKLKDFVFGDAPELKLPHQSAAGEDTLEAMLNFRKDDTTRASFWNSFELQVNHPDSPERDKKQTFYIRKGFGFTLKQAYNLLEGRSVLKEMTAAKGNKYTAWHQLDFDKTTSNGNYVFDRVFPDKFDVSKLLEQLPIRYPYHDSRENLEKDLNRGNAAKVVFEHTATEEEIRLAKANKADKIPSKESVPGFISANARSQELVLSGNLVEFLAQYKDQKKNEDLTERPGQKNEKGKSGGRSKKTAETAGGGEQKSSQKKHGR